MLQKVKSYNYNDIFFDVYISNLNNNAVIIFFIIYNSTNNHFLSKDLDIFKGKFKYNVKFNISFYQDNRFLRSYEEKKNHSILNLLINDINLEVINDSKKINLRYTENIDKNVTYFDASVLIKVIAAGRYPIIELWIFEGITDSNSFDGYKYIEYIVLISCNKNSKKWSPIAVLIFFTDNFSIDSKTQRIWYKKENIPTSYYTIHNLLLNITKTTDNYLNLSLNVTLGSDIVKITCDKNSDD
ncbi:MAG: hypothetical protein QW210_03575 [Candidatus Woesearchaeota archaeon]